MIARPRGESLTTPAPLTIPTCNTERDNLIFLTPNPASKIQMESCKISSSALLRVLEGVSVAAKLRPHTTDRLARCFSSPAIKDEPDNIQSPKDWLVKVSSMLGDEKETLGVNYVGNLAIAIAFLREHGRQAQNDSQAAIEEHDQTMIWELVRDALINAPVFGGQFQASRSAQGFLSVALCSLVEDGNIIELFRFHVWLPDGQRGVPEFAVHSHQPFAQSWILAGKGTDYSFDVRPAADLTTATHAEYKLGWNDGKTTGTAYKTHQLSSKVVNTGNLVSVNEIGCRTHTRNASYTIPAVNFHRTEVAPDSLHATLFFFDASRGFVKDAPVLGPKDLGSSTQLRDPAGITPSALAVIVDTVRSWEVFMEQGEQHAQQSEWEHALRSFSHALGLCGPDSRIPNADSYRHIVLAKLGNTNRRFGRYEKAEEYLDSALKGLTSTALHVEVSGELGVVYRHMNRINDAKRQFEIQYELAKQLDLKHVMCRAIGNLGMVNYQLSVLDEAIEQLSERVQLAREIKHSALPNQRHNPTVWESIGLSRLSLCYMARGLLKEAIDSASTSLEVSLSIRDPTVIAMSRLFYGRALLLSGQKEEALLHLNPPGTCTPAMALCKEPSDEHLLYLQEIVDAGAAMDVVDEQGYSALDYAVFCGNKAAEEIILDGLRRQSFGTTEILYRQKEARVRKCYRELFQEHLRPVLLEKSGEVGHLQRLRQVYTVALAADEEKSRMLDGFKFLWYSDFVRNGRLPRSSHGLTQHLNGTLASNAPDSVVFISYRWMNGSPDGVPSPDDSNNTQYKRMIRAVEAFLDRNPSMNRKKMGIWLDWACVDQDDPLPGVSALPLILAQCDAVISLCDSTYHSRAWCSVEVMMIQMLRKSYGLHSWYVHNEVDGTKDGSLEEGPLDFETSVMDKALTMEEDRPRILFLERQTTLFGLS